MSIKVLSCHCLLSRAATSAVQQPVSPVSPVQAVGSRAGRGAALPGTAAQGRTAGAGKGPPAPRRSAQDG